jgi:hypothetical protein
VGDLLSTLVFTKLIRISEPCIEPLSLLVNGNHTPHFEIPTSCLKPELTPLSRILRENCIWSKNPSPFIESEVWLPCSQEPATGIYPEPVASSLYRRNLFNIRFNITLPCTDTFLISPMRLYVPPISSTLIWSPTSCNFLHPLRSKHSPQHPLFKHLQSIFLPRNEGPWTWERSKILNRMATSIHRT